MPRTIVNTNIQTTSRNNKAVANDLTDLATKVPVPGLGDFAYVSSTKSIWTHDGTQWNNTETGQNFIEISANGDMVAGGLAFADDQYFLHTGANGNWQSDGTTSVVQNTVYKQVAGALEEVITVADADESTILKLPSGWVESDGATWIPFNASTPSTQLTQVQVENSLSTDFGEVSGERLAQAIDERIKNILPWVSTNTGYELGDEVTHLSPSLNLYRKYRAKANIVQKTTFDEAEWDNLGAVPKQTKSRAFYFVADRTASFADLNLDQNIPVFYSTLGNLLLILPKRTNGNRPLINYIDYSGKRTTKIPSGANENEYTLVAQGTYKVFNSEQDGGIIWIKELTSGYNNVVELLTAAPTNALVPGSYVLDSTTAAFAIDLENTKGEWIFTNPMNSLSTNAVTITSTGDSFTDAAGVQQTTDFILDAEGSIVRIQNTSGGNDFFVSVDRSLGATSPYGVGGAWDASTNTPDLSLPENRINSNGVYLIWFVTQTGTQDIGKGPELYEQGGEIKSYGTGATEFRYDNPLQAMSAGLLANFSPTDPDYSVVKAWSGERINERLGQLRGWYDSTTGVFDPNTLLVTSNETFVAFDETATVTNMPLGHTTGMSGFVTVEGITTGKGRAIAFIDNHDSQLGTGIWYRTKVIGVWSDWQKFAEDTWIETDTIVGTLSVPLGSKVVLAENKQISLTRLTRTDIIPVRLVPRNDWLGVLQPITSDAGWTVEEMPKSGKQEVLCIPNFNTNTWEVKKFESGENVEVLQSISVTVTGYSSSFTVANNFVFIDADGTDISSNDFEVISDTGSSYTGVLGSVGFNPPVNASRTFTVRYIGNSTRRGLTALRVSLRPTAASTGVTRIEAKYFSGNSQVYTRSGAGQGTVTYTLPNEFSFLTDPTPPTIDSAAVWDTDSEYTGTNNVQFRLTIPSTDANGPFVTADGVTLEAGKTYNLYYVSDRTAADSISVIADDAATVAEILLMNFVGVVTSLNAIPVLIPVDDIQTGGSISATGAADSRLLYIGTTADAIYYYDNAGAFIGQIEDQPSSRWADGATVYVKSTGNTYRYNRAANKFSLIPSSEGLRKAPVADIAALQAVVAENAMHQTVLDDGTGARAEYVFNLGKTPIGNDVADNATTGAWEKIEIYATVASNEIGVLKQIPNVKEDGTAKTSQDYVNDGFLPLINGYRLTDGATNNPKFAAMFPSFVSGTDLLVPNTFDGGFVRNLGGDASAFMTFQDDATAANGLRILKSFVQWDWTAAANNIVSKGANSGLVNDGQALSSTDVETRPVNFAMQFCLVLDSYSKTLIIKAEGLITQDQASSGYMDFGTMRMQWGLHPSGSNGAVTLPQPFANNTFTVTANTVQQDSKIGIPSKTTTSFNYASTNSTGGLFATLGMNWMAIGLKP